MMRKASATALLVLSTTGNVSAADSVFTGGFAVVAATGCARNYTEFRRPSVYHSPLAPNLNFESISLHGVNGASLYATTSKPFSKANGARGTLIDNGRLTSFAPTVIVSRVYKNASGTILAPNGLNLSSVTFIQVSGSILKFANDRSTCKVTFKANYSKL